MKDLTCHSCVKSHIQKLRCSACGGSTIKMYSLLLWAATLIGLSGGYCMFLARLSSLHCMLYVIACLCTWGARLCFCHDWSSRVFAPFDSFLFFFQPCSPPRLHPPKRPQTSTYMEEYGNRRGHYMQFWCTYRGLRLHPRPLFWFRACKCCMYVRLEAQLSNTMFTNASGGVAPTFFWPPPVSYPVVWGMGGNVSRETNFGSESEAAPSATR